MAHFIVFNCLTWLQHLFHFYWGSIANSGSINWTAVEFIHTELNSVMTVDLMLFHSRKIWHCVDLLFFKLFSWVFITMFSSPWLRALVIFRPTLPPGFIFLKDGVIFIQKNLSEDQIFCVPGVGTFNFIWQLYYTQPTGIWQKFWVTDRNPHSCPYMYCTPLPGFTVASLIIIVIIFIIIIILHSIVFKRDWFSPGWILCNCLLCSDIIIHVQCFGHCDGPLTLYQNVIMIILQCYGV